MKGGVFDITLASPLPVGARTREPAETRDVCDRFVGWPGAARGTLFRWIRMRHLVSTLPIAVATDDSEAGRRAIARELKQGPNVVVVDFPHAAVLAPQRPAIANYAKYPAVHWFSFCGLRDFLEPLGFRCLDRFDLIDTGGKGGLVQFIVTTLRGVPLLRFLGHVATASTYLVAVKSNLESGDAAR